MQRVYKYPFEINDEVIVHMPEGAEVLHVDAQHDAPCIWAMVDDRRAMAPYLFYVVGTGHPADHVCTGQHIGSVMMDGGALVFHVFQR